MKRHVFRFDSDPLTRTVVVGTATIKLQIVEAEIGAGVHATVRTFNGKPEALHSGRLCLDSEIGRKRYLKALAGIDPTLDCPDLAQAFMLLSVDLAEKLAKEAEAGPQEQAHPVDTAALWKLAEPLALASDLMDQVVGAMRGHGLVGEAANAKLLYLCATARLREKPVSVVVKGPSASGKSHLIERVVELLPVDAYVNFTTISPRFLAYSNHDLRHKIVVIYEAGGMDEGLGAYVMRSLLSEGCLRIGTVDRGDSDAIEAREIVKEGPTSLFTSSTRASIDPELETRALSLGTTDTAVQSRAIMRGVAARHEGEAEAPVDLAPFHALQQWLAAAGETRVRIPFAKQLAECVPTLAIRIRRDFPKLLELIAASAMLHQAQRQKAGDGCLIASLDDYRVVHDVVQEVFGAAQQDGLTDKQRKAVAAVIATQENSAPGVSLTVVARHLGIDKSAASRRLANPVAQGFVKNLESQKGHPARYAPGEPLPAAVSTLPTPETLERQEEIDL